MFGLIFTLVSLTIISSSTKSDDESNIPSEMGDHLMEKKVDIQDKEDIESRDGGKDQNAHVFAISPATIMF